MTNMEIFRALSSLISEIEQGRDRFSDSYGPEDRAIEERMDLLWRDLEEGLGKDPRKKLWEFFSQDGRCADCGGQVSDGKCTVAECIFH